MIKFKIKNIEKIRKDLENSLNKNHSGIGGLYFLTSAICCSVIMLIALQLSWDSQAVAMADNLAYITSINTTVVNYTIKNEDFNTPNPSIPKSNGGTYEPLKDFNNMLKDCGLSDSGSSVCYVTWNENKKQSTVQFGEFKTSLGTYVKPHRQESTIEND